MVSYSELSARWGLSKATVGRLIKKLEQLDYLAIMSFPGRRGSVIYLKNYLSTMFQISDVIIDKEEIAMVLHIPFSLSDQEQNIEEPAELEICVSNDLPCVSKQNILPVIQKVSKVLAAQGISCFRCPKSTYKLLPLSEDCWEVTVPRSLEEKVIRFKLQICCGSGSVIYSFALTLSPADNSDIGGSNFET